jgi:hypothetical protein
LEVLTGSPAQPAATIDRAMTSPKVIYLVFILFSTSVIDVIDMVSVFRVAGPAPSLTWTLGIWALGFSAGRR